MSEWIGRAPGRVLALAITVTIAYVTAVVIVIT